MIRKLISYFAEKTKTKKLLITAYEKIYDSFLTIKSTILYIPDRIFCKKNKLNILSIQDTINYILETKCSVSRFGDGEFNLSSGSSIGFQAASSDLSEKLKSLLSSPSSAEGVLICLPGSFAFPDEYEKHTKKFWRKILVQKRKEWYSFCDKGYCFGNADITRCYIEFADKSPAEKYFNDLKKIWNGLDLLIVEGEKTRLGVGNDLFANAKSIKRILCPPTNAYDHYADIKDCIIEFAQNKLILLALGPTSTILSVDLSNIGHRAIDIGNIDKEYEWFLSKATKKQRNPIKYTQEVTGGTNVEDCTDVNYCEEIIARVGLKNGGNQ